MQIVATVDKYIVSIARLQRRFQRVTAMLTRQRQGQIMWRGVNIWEKQRSLGRLQLGVLYVNVRILIIVCSVNSSAFYTVLKALHYCRQTWGEASNSNLRQQMSKEQGYWMQCLYTTKASASVQ